MVTTHFDLAGNFGRHLRNPSGEKLRFGDMGKESEDDGKADVGWDFCSALWQLNLQGNQVLLRLCLFDLVSIVITTTKNNITNNSMNITITFTKAHYNG